MYENNPTIFDWMLLFFNSVYNFTKIVDLKTQKDDYSRTNDQICCRQGREETKNSHWQQDNIEVFLLQHCTLKPFKFNIINSQIAVKIQDCFTETVAALPILRTIRLRNVLKNDVKGSQAIYFDFFNRKCKNNIKLTKREAIYAR